MMNTNQWKQFYQYASIFSLALFFILFVVESFTSTAFILNEYKGVFVVIYLFTSLKHYKLVVKEKDSLIIKLQQQLQKNKRKAENLN